MSLYNLKQLLTQVVASNERKLLTSNDEKELLALMKQLNQKLTVDTTNRSRTRDGVYKAESQTISFAPQGTCSCCGR